MWRAAGHLEVAKWLVAQGADIGVNFAGETALHDACLHGSLPTIEWLLTMPQPATSTGGEGQAVPRSVEELINKRTQQGITPLALAALGGHTEVVRALIGKGANKASAADEEGHSSCTWRAATGISARRRP